MILREGCLFDGNILNIDPEVISNEDVFWLLRLVKWLPRGLLDVWLFLGGSFHKQAKLKLISNHKNIEYQIKQDDLFDKTIANSKNIFKVISQSIHISHFHYYLFDVIG